MFSVPVLSEMCVETNELNSSKAVTSFHVTKIRGWIPLEIAGTGTALGVKHL